MLSQRDLFPCRRLCVSSYLSSRYPRVRQLPHWILATHLVLPVPVMSSRARPRSPLDGLASVQKAELRPAAAE